jgi:translation initiation factor 1
MGNEENTRLVYSTDAGRICPQCGLPVENCRCSQNRSSSTRHTDHTDGAARIALDRKHRRGKMMTIVSGAPGDEAELAQLCRELKKLLATGGSTHDGQVELQGDHRERVAAYFAARGIKTKRVGG